jgi:hypothetical protein
VAVLGSPLSNLTSMYWGHQAKDDSRVYILGAGASYQDTLSQTTPLPLATQFFEDRYVGPGGFWDYKTWEVDHPFNESHLRKILQHSFGYVPGKKTTVNVEDVFSFLEVYLSTYSSSASSRHILEEARRELLHYVINLIRKLSNAGYKRDCLHDLILKSLRKIDSVFTFNWDVLIDNAKTLDIYWKVREPLYKSILNPNGGLLTNEEAAAEWRNKERHNLSELGLVLRLHGSVGLAHCTDQSCPGNAMPVELYGTYPYAERERCGFCGSGLKSMILPPFVHKTYRSNRFINLQARFAAQKIKEATELVLIGYSLPESDYEALTLMRLFRSEPGSSSSEDSHRDRTLIVVDPAVDDSNFHQKLERLFSPSSTFENTIHFKSYYSIQEFIEADLNPRRETILKEKEEELAEIERRKHYSSSYFEPQLEWWEKEIKQRQERKAKGGT